MASKLAQGRHAACGGGARSARGGAASNRRRHGRNRSGEKLGELEWVARKLTAQSIWTEDGRREKLDERAELRRGAAMAPDGREADSAREQVKRARDG